MARSCSICESEARVAIEEALFVGAESLRDIASRFGTSKSSLARHKAGHQAAGVVVEVEEEDFIESDPLEETLLEKQANLILELQDQRTRLSKELREVEDLLEICDKRDKVSHARSLLL